MIVKKNNKVASTTKRLMKIIKIEYLYLDLKTCDRCVGTDAVLEKVIRELAPAFKLAGYLISYKKTEIATEQDAIDRRFISSPTLLVNGIDICPEVKESDCRCCGEISGTQVDCRVFEYNGKSYNIPPKAMLAEAILKNAFLSDKGNISERYELPENLKKFFAGKKRKNLAK